jgi:uncharacterized membrane protein
VRFIVNLAHALALVLAVALGCLTLAIIAPNLNGGGGLASVHALQSAAPQRDCVDDVSVTISSQWGVIERTTYTLKDPPDYKAGDDIGIYYDITNSSCREISVTVGLRGSISGAVIHNTDDTDDMACLEGCTVTAGDVLYGNAGWDLAQHPNATGEKVIATVTVTAPDGFVDANPDNNSATSAQSINIVNEEPDPAPDIAIKSVTPSVSEAVVGDSVDFTVTVQNEGDADATAATTVTLDYGADTDELDSATVTALAAGDAETVTLTWDTDGAAPGEHSLRALAQTDGDGNSDNDSRTASVTLEEPSVDVAVKSVTGLVDEAVVGDTVEFTVTLENRGNVAAATPAVSLFDADGAEDAEALASGTANTIAVGDEATISISWDTGDATAGEYSLRVVAAVADDDDSNNDSATATLTLHNRVDVSLSFTDAIGPTAISESVVQIGFTLNNTGDHATGEVTVSLYLTVEGEERGEQEPTAATTVPTIAVGGSANGSLDWDTADVAVGRYDLEVVIHTVGDTNETNNSVSASIEIRNWLLLKSVSPTSAAAVSGDTVNFTAQVENVGQSELTAVTVSLYASGSNEALASATIASVATGDTEDASIKWDTTGHDAGQVELFIAAGADGQVPDGDDSQSVNVTIRNPVALSSATLASADNTAGASVSINVQALNESNAEVTNVAVDLFVGDAENPGDSTTIESIAAGETAATSLTWDASDAEPGEHELKIIASLADYGRDPNDAVPLTVDLRAPVMAVALAAAAINRNVAAIGQTLDVTAKITNYSEAPVAVPVRLYLVTRLDQTTAASTATSSLIEPGSSADVTLQWNSTSETTGRHTLKVAAELPEDTTAHDNEKILEVELFRSAFEGDGAPENCVEDVRVKVTGVSDFNGEKRSPPNHYVGETLRANYSIYNLTCQTDLTLALTMSGPQDHVISDPAALCFSDCVVPFGGKVEGEVAWTIPTLPALSDQPVSAAVTVVSPSGFADINEANNSAESTDLINVVHPDDIVWRLGEETGNKVSTHQPLTGPEFGAVDVRLVSVDPPQATLPFAAATVQVAVAVANDGPATEPATVRVIMVPDDGTDPKELYRHNLVVPAGEAKSTSLEVPVTDLLPGTHTVEVLLSAAVDQSPGNNAATFEFTRLGPMVSVEIAEVAISPNALILGDDATVSFEVQNNSEIALHLELELYLDDDPEPIGTETLDELAPEGQSPERIAWRVPASARELGQHTLTLMASSDDFGAIATVNAEVTFHIDAEILRINSSPEETAMQSEEVAIEVEVQNNGPAAVNVPVTLRFPSTAKAPEVRSPPVPPGETGIARFTWKTGNYAVGEHVLLANVPDEHNIASGKTSMELPFRLTPLAVTATIVDVSVYPEAPRVGEPVRVTVAVRNAGSVAANIPITLHFPPGGRQPETRKPRGDPGQTGTVTFDLITSHYQPGAHAFVVEVNSTPPATRE